MSLTKPDLNIAGIKNIKYVFTEEVAIMPNDINLELDEEDIVLNSGKAWKDFYFTPGTIFIDELEKEDNAGILYFPTIKFIYPKDTKIATQELNSICKRRFLLKIKDNSNIILLYGNLINPLNMFYAKKKGAGPNNENHYEIQFEGKTMNPAIYLNASQSSA